jgi:hypothetical protein
MMMVIGVTWKTAAATAARKNHTGRSGGKD